MALSVVFEWQGETAGIVLGVSDNSLQNCVISMGHIDLDDVIWCRLSKEDMQELTKRLMNLYGV